MKTQIHAILLKTLVSNYDDGNIEDGGIGGGDEAIEELYKLFTDKMDNKIEDK
jgi:hypothetical protein